MNRSMGILLVGCSLLNFAIVLMLAKVSYRLDELSHEWQSGWAYQIPPTVYIFIAIVFIYGLLTAFKK
ncbi:hypothetical protein [Falsibacillus albus]|uniref:Uncharacterized protein n=1 Tax=Falsibacillus albus TaxID=2478915 RepID=A0A3L7K2U8_9BACI|nr:hypothetical protein [Falsibacillus albus]RLQ97427.1 hypothetical protein D9X91_04540 [Falsibacillus albus]